MFALEHICHLESAHKLRYNYVICTCTCLLQLEGNKEDPEETIGCPFHWKSNVRMAISKYTFRMTICMIQVFEKVRHLVKEIFIMEEL